jgi:hypothetical protein
MYNTKEKRLKHFEGEGNGKGRVYPRTGYEGLE